MEDERQRIENERWTIDQNIVDLEKQIMGISAEESELKEEEVEVEHKIERIKKMLLALQAKSEKDEVEKKLEEIVVSRVQLENEWKEIMETKKKAEAIDAEYLRQEAVLQAEIQAIEAEEQTATKDKKHEFETIRWEKEKQLRRLEEEDWKDEEDVKELQRLTEDLQNRTQSVLSLEKQTKTKIAELNALIASAEEDE
jgi:peptidoglycan hydrolase CwlO-like protein